MNIKYFFKVLGAGLVSFIILNIFCLLYYNVPLQVNSTVYATDYMWEKNTFYSRVTEGFAWGKTDSKGYNNLNDYDKSDIDILVMGSSHMEAYNVAQNNNCAYLLDKKLDKNVYNIGVSGHYCDVCLNNIKNAADEFSPKDYIVMEINRIISHDGVKMILNDEYVHMKYTETGIIRKLQAMPYIRCAYTKFRALVNVDNDESDRGVSGKNYKEDLEKLLGDISDYLSQKDIELIVLYNKGLELDGNGVVIAPENDDCYYTFKSVCDKYKIHFIDMFEDFKNYYNDTDKLPHGFSNTAVGRGHLNKTGHEVISNVLADYISEKEDIR